VCLLANNELQSLSIKGLMHRQIELKKDLDNVGDINHNAVEEFKRHQRDFDEHKETAKKLTEAEDAIINMIKEFDERKCKCLETAFHNVNKHFEDIFGQIVHNGKARLVRSGDTKKDLVRDENEKPVGISIRASFSGQPNSYHKMQQLSGGQRTVIAVSLIFAFQKAEAAPIYVLDEIDAALDDQYRYQVGKIMSAASEKSQFIMTTFRKQVAEFGRRFIHIDLKDRASVHKQVDKDGALAVISEQQELDDK